MATNDWAVIVGVQSYPELDDLEGPENDARAFKQWIECPTGGDVPKDHIKLILSSNYSPPFSAASKAAPTYHPVQQAFDELREIAEINSRNGEGRYVGRRLYIYLAGHGCELEPFPQVQHHDEVVLLMANATPRSAGYSIPGRLYANHFLQGGLFDELVLFMDCCRQSYPKVPPHIPYTRDKARDVIDPKNYCYGFGTKSSYKSRERLMDNGLVHGVFTMALLKGLRGAACEPNGQITAASLQAYLFNDMKKFMSLEDRQNPSIAKEPEVECHSTAGQNFVITHTASTKFSVTIHIPANSLGKKVEILQSQNFSPIASGVVYTPDWDLSVDRGMYLAQILEDSLQVLFEVSGTEEVVHVSF